VATDDITLQQAADALGVHYMTAYRYVRHGQLEARKVDGEWRVSSAALDAFRAGARRPRVGRGARSAPWAERMEARLVAGDAAGAWGVVEAAMAAGASPDRVYTEVISPALVSIGDRWAGGELDIASEHRATAVVQRLIGRLGPHFGRRGRTRGVVVVGAPAGETHSLVVSMLADLLRGEGWEVSDLGADVPAESFVTAVSEVDPVAVIISVTASDSLPAAAHACASLRTHHPETRVVLGGRAVVDERSALELGADAFSADVDTLASLLAGYSAASRSA
jgi:excisionase family DNA binding protein